MAAKQKEFHYKFGLRKTTVLIKGAERRVFPSRAEAARFLGASGPELANVISGQQLTVRGYSVLCKGRQNKV